MAPGIEAGIRITIACVCMCCRRPSTCLGGSERIRPRTLVLSVALLCFALLLPFFFLSFFFSLFWLSLYFGWEIGRPMPPLSSLQAWVIPFAACSPVPYRALLDLAGPFVSFSVEYLAVGRPGITSVASIHSASTGLVRYLGHLSYSCKLRLGFGGFFIIENLAPFDVVHGYMNSFWIFHKTCLSKLSRVAYLYYNCSVETERPKLVLLLLLEPRSQSPIPRIYCIFPGDLWYISPTST